jgi:hypothetical protein
MIGVEPPFSPIIGSFPRKVCKWSICLRKRWSTIARWWAIWTGTVSRSVVDDCLSSCCFLIINDVIIIRCRISIVSIVKRWRETVTLQILQFWNIQIGQWTTSSGCQPFMKLSQNSTATGSRSGTRLDWGWWLIDFTVGTLQAGQKSHPATLGRRISRFEVHPLWTLINCSLSLERATSFLLRTELGSADLFYLPTFVAQMQFQMN